MATVHAPFRIHDPSLINKGAHLNPPAVPPGTTQTPGDPFLTRLVKLIPAEVLAIYLAGIELSSNFPGIWSFVCLLLVVISRIWGTKENGMEIQWLAVFVSSVSFIIWVYAMGNYFFDWRLPDSNAAIASLAVLVWTFVVPHFYKGN